MPDFAETVTNFFVFMTKKSKAYCIKCLETNSYIEKLKISSKLMVPNLLLAQPKHL